MQPTKMGLRQAMSPPSRSWLVLPCVILACLLAGCARRPPQAAPSVPVTIPISIPVVRPITDFVDFTGRTDAIQSVDIRPRSTGYLIEMPFQEGTEVKQGDLLFVIDPRPYKAQLDQAIGQVNLYQAQLKLARTTLARDLAINRMTPNAVSRQQLDQEEAAVEEADARVKAYEKNMRVYELNHEFTRVVSPISGMISRYYLTLGNLVNQDQTLLTTIISMDPIYAYFDMDEPTLLRIRMAINQGKLQPKRSRGMEVPLFLGLQGETGFPHKGKVNFVNNQLNPTTGSILVRGIFPNPKPTGGTRLISPGMFVRIRLPIGDPHPAVLVLDQAISSDQGLKYVYVLNQDNQFQYRRIATGALQDDGLRVVTEGLKADEWVVVRGLQQVQQILQSRPPAKFRTEQIAMPTLGQENGGKATDAEPGSTKAESTARPQAPAR
jgi:RND family efflux transporter MFP subunit